MCRATEGASDRAIWKSWPLGLASTAPRIASTRSASDAPPRITRAQIGGVLAAKAGVQRAGAGQPHPVAGLAEIVAERGDEPQPSAGLGHLDIARRPAGGERQVGQRPEALQLGPQRRQRQVLVRPVGLDLAHRHGLDQRHVGAAPVRPADQVGQFGGVVVLQRHGVDLDLQPRGLRRLDPGEHLGQVAAAGQRAEQVRASAYPARH